MNYTSIKEIDSLKKWVKQALKIKKDPLKNQRLGKDKTLVMLFFNPSLRTRLSTQKAAINLGMNVMVMNFGAEGWTLEFEDGTIMNQGASEHIKEAAEVVSQYCDIIAIRAFAGLTDKEKDNAETVMNGFVKYATVPIVNMESATGHPLQSLADAITMAEFKTKHKPKVVLTWAPHPKALPQAVANSFVEMMQLQRDMDFVITHPEGSELNPFFNTVAGDAPQEADVDGDSKPDLVQSIDSLESIREDLEEVMGENKLNSRNTEFLVDVRLEDSGKALLDQDLDAVIATAPEVFESLESIKLCDERSVPQILNILRDKIAEVKSI